MEKSKDDVKKSIQQTAAVVPVERLGAWTNVVALENYASR